MSLWYAGKKVSAKRARILLRAGSPRLYSTWLEQKEKAETTLKNVEANAFRGGTGK